MDIGNSFWTLPDPIFWLLSSGLVFLAMTIIFLLGPFRKDKSELMQGFLGFLAGMSCFHLFLAAAMYQMNVLLAVLAAFGAMTGSAFLLKFPLLAMASDTTRKNLFYAALAIGWGLTAWLLITAMDPMLPMMVGATYMIIVSGALGGFYIVWKGLHFSDPALKVKCVGGGCSIIFCCFLTHIIVLTVGMTVLAKTFMILTPVSLVAALYIARVVEKQR